MRLQERDQHGMILIWNAVKKKLNSKEIMKTKREEIIQKQEELIKLLLDRNFAAYNTPSLKDCEYKIILLDEIAILKAEPENDASELTRDELITRYCEMKKEYQEMKEEWFKVVQMGEKPDPRTI